MGELTKGKWMTDLPKAPVAPLDVTLRRYIQSLEAVVPGVQLNVTKKLVEDFQKNHGPPLQKLLEKSAHEKDNWATEVWLPDMYLCNRTPLPINQSAFFLLPRQSFKSPRDQLLFSAYLLKFSLHFKQLIETETLPQDVAGTHTKTSLMCMSTYKAFFNSYRRPGVERDYQLSKKDTPFSNSVVVIYKKQFARLDMEPKSTVDSIAATLLRIRQVVDQGEIQVPLGVLTTQQRGTWADHYELLKKNNPQNLDALERSLLVLCLDEAQPVTSAGLTKTEQCKALLHGKGVNVNSTNRWYDKTIQMVVSADGVSGVVMEHSQSEGITLLRFLDMFQVFQKEQSTNIDWNAAPCKHERMMWKVPEPITKAISTAKDTLQKLVDDVDFYVLHFKEFGKEFPKSQKMSPDVFVQLSLQLTYFKVHRKLVSTYESASLRRFSYGRADTIRAATKEALEWVKAMCDVTETTQEKKEDLFRKAVAKQTEILKYTVQGEGPDNHLLGLKEMAKKIRLSTKLFTDKSYTSFLNFQLSTSQLPNESGVTVGYGAVVPDGYGVSYTVGRDDMVFCVASFHSSNETSSDFFARSLEGSLNQMRELYTRKQSISAELSTPAPSVSASVLEPSK